jgi:hypothetical protein
VRETGGMVASNWVRDVVELGAESCERSESVHQQQLHRNEALAARTLGLVFLFFDELCCEYREGGLWLKKMVCRAADTEIYRFADSISA